MSKMWLGKFLDLEDDMKEFRSKIQKQIFTNIKKNKLTPLEFTIIEAIFNNQQLWGYDLIRVLNDHFAGTWEAQSGTIYPILSKLKRDGFLKTIKVKSPVGPIKKVYSLTEAGEKILKIKVNKNFHDQLTFVENFLRELSTVYIHSLPESQREKGVRDVQELLKTISKNVITSIPSSVEIPNKCKKCGSEISRQEAKFCENCGEPL
ncbi:MAG: zinc-ribbon domain-containing protein [Promethearchaeota archaeon]|nr:MAG: zinc-ribbon domain-containing protein [Candidatus Lokiarchaeota archaeon]